MTALRSLRGRTAAAAVLITALASSSPVFAAAPSPGEWPVQVTMRDVDASNKKVAMAYSALMDMWTKSFERIGENFAPPQIVRYTGTGDTDCGLVEPNNAVYCPDNNTVYYDEVFVAGMQKVVGKALGSDGDMAGVGIIAHEVGHAVAMQLGHESISSYVNESTADCLAGAFAKQSQRDGFLEKGDLDEAIQGMAMAGDPPFESTGDERTDRILRAELARDSHGTKAQRMQNFRKGLDRGAGACLKEFK